jgi:acyl-coenzyme A synthetase/AMP-(fatty) acid ligase
MELFFADIGSNTTISWKELLKDLNRSTTYNPYCYHSDFYEIFKHIILSLLLEEELILLDSDFSDEEVEKLTGRSNFSSFTKIIDPRKLPVISLKNELISKIKNTGPQWNITLFTSGTTGLPKKVKHTFQSLNRFVKITEQNTDDVWGFAYNPTHIAGIQVFFQALLNGNSIIRLFGLSTDLVFNSIEQYGITHISATPTFYRLLYPINKIFPNVVRITVGGEKFDEKTIDKLKPAFPNSKITNVYASTEAGTLFAAKGDVFTVKAEMEKFVKIENNQLFIHKYMMGLTENKINSWYNTGDIVEIVSENPLQFRFVSRKNEMINVGGYKVNPNEVEEAIRTINGISDVRVFAKSNSVLGNIICCEIVKIDENLDEAKIRSFLQTQLQEYKIPRFIKFVNELSTTRTGKIKRN